MIFLYRSAYKSIEDLSRKEMRLGGLRVDPDRHIGSRTNYYNKVKIAKLDEGKSAKEINGLPSKINLSNFQFSPDESKIAMTNTTENGVEVENLFCVDATKLDFEKNFFDYSYSIGSMEHFTEDGIAKLIEKLSKITKKTSIHMMPVSKKNINEGWIKTYQSFHNNSPEWWINKFEKCFKKVEVIDSSWEDHISKGKWFVCHK